MSPENTKTQTTEPVAAQARAALAVAHGFKQAQTILAEAAKACPEDVAALGELADLEEQLRREARPYRQRFIELTNLQRASR